jgi:hypothetical protein
LTDRRDDGGCGCLVIVLLLILLCNVCPRLGSDQERLERIEKKLEMKVDR